MITKCRITRHFPSIGQRGISLPALWIITGIVALLIIIAVFGVAPGKISPDAGKKAGDFYGLNCAHRGLFSKDQKTPENSLPAFAAAKEHGYGVELDVRLTKDEKIVVFHDDDLMRVCGVDKPVHSLDYDELSGLTLFDTGERIPLFSEALEVIGDTPLIVELKSDRKNIAMLCENTLNILRKYGKTWCIESFDPNVGAWFKKNAPGVLRGQLSSIPVKLDSISRLTAFLLGNLLTNFLSRPHFIAYSNDPYPPFVRFCMLMKPMKVIWTVHSDDDIKRCKKDNDVIIFEHYTPDPRFK